MEEDGGVEIPLAESDDDDFEGVIPSVESPEEVAENVLPPTGTGTDMPLTIENPFRHQSLPHTNTKRDHFPSFDQAVMMRTGSPATSSSSSRNTNLSSHNNNNNNNNNNSNENTRRSPNALNQSNASSTANSNASSLNMSIGARAVLNDHLRHIAKHGLDNSNSSNAYTGSPTHQHPPKSQESITPPRNPLDAVWDDILEGTDEKADIDRNNNPPPSPPAGATLRSSSFQSPPDLDRIDTIVSVSSGDEEGTVAIEVSPKMELAGMNTPDFARRQPRRSQQQSSYIWDPHAQDDNQSRSSKSTASYFQSERVQELHTPERNQSMLGPQHQSVTLRNTSYSPATPSILEGSSITADHSMTMAQMFQALTMGSAGGVSPPPMDTSFASFGVGAADLSRITATGGTPETSYAQQQSSISPSHHNQLLFPSWDDDSFHGHMLDVPPPPPPPPPASRRSTSNLTKNPSTVRTVTDSAVWRSFPMPRMHRSLSPPEIKRPPLLQKQHSCPTTAQQSVISDEAPWDEAEAVFSAAARKAGLLALAQEQPNRGSEQEPPPTENLMDFFRDVTAGPGSSSISSRDNPSVSSPPGFFLSGKTDSAPITIAHSQDTSDISTIHNESSSGVAQQNTSSSSSSIMGKPPAASVMRRQTRTGKPPSDKRQKASGQPYAAVSPQNKSSSSSSSHHGSKHLDRRRYRTVVPSRVFLKDEPKEGFFPAPRDSFSFDNSLSPQRQLELEASFEAASQESAGVEETEELQKQPSRRRLA
ncbi:expressed unknown protein [Seminavis robusta]|uniref:Uncharacterized protein n=1 Tax=Seminavis robusta TaxID=568900 RepID=A0A9N8DIC7_9STRA|nr:expressed unknown protein [Seminavis robusta]|eukprot:Sro168_g074690.1 n/a (760) ;mRNA; f:11807-14173